MNIRFEGKAKVIADFESYNVVTDLDKSIGGESEGLNPFQLFLVSLSCCTGLFARQYMEKHGIALADKHIEVTFDFDDSSDLRGVNIKLFVGNNFPADNETPLINAMKVCKVKKHLRTDIDFRYEIIRK
ncbi:MAG: OsmC family protein [Bacteroidales bacterium]|jgi:uncharacterized OsmC-like protein|nr:OsmC family protein [Bacteroidales bacterium]